MFQVLPHGRLDLRAGVERCALFAPLLDLLRRRPRQVLQLAKKGPLELQRAPE